MWNWIVSVPGVAFSSSLIVFILRPSQNVTSVLAMCIFQHLPRGLANVKA